MSNHFSASSIIFGQAPEELPKNNAPATQFIILLSGVIEIESTIREKKQFKAGDVLVSNDLESEVHCTRFIGEGPYYYSAIPF